ncbi:MAG: hypothetical protein GX951_02105 [Mollicutes bacterium]|nr:hypothetical protein [Mollicutes bacterium]
MNVIVANKYQALLSNLNIDVIKNLNGTFTVDELVSQFKNFFFNKMILDITALAGYENINTIQKLSVALDMNKIILLLDDSPKVNSPLYLSQLVSLGIYNFTKNVEALSFLIDNPNTYKDVASFHQLNMSNQKAGQYTSENPSDSFMGQRIYGIKNLTPHAGSTTLTYILKKHLEKAYKVKAIEIDNSDFKYFNDDDIISATSFELKDILNKNKDLEIILIDLPASGEGESYCTDVLYLIEPGRIQLNRLVAEDNRIFEKLKNKKLILNKSILSNGDVTDFERESGSKVFFNVPSIDDKTYDTKAIKELLAALGFTRIEDSNPKKGFGIFG